MERLNKVCRQLTPTHSSQSQIVENKLNKSTAADRTFHPDLAKKLSEYRQKRNFNAKEWVKKKVSLFNDYLRKWKLSGALVSVSGGVDSAVTLALIKRASEEKNSPLKRVLGVAQPIHSSDWALNRAKELSKKLNTELIIVDQTKLHTELSTLIDKAVGVDGGSFAKGQLRSYMRTPAAYYIAQILSQQGNPTIVMGTGNKDEDGYLAYFCKAGDGVVDVQLIADLHKSEVFLVGKELGVTESILKAAPSADLWEGQTDEDELGFSYDFVELLTGAYLPLDEEGRKKFKASLSKEALEQFDKWDKAAEQIHYRNKHKLQGPVNINVL